MSEVMLGGDLAWWVRAVPCVLGFLMMAVPPGMAMQYELSPAWPRLYRTVPRRWFVAMVAVMLAGFVVFVFGVSRPRGKVAPGWFAAGAEAREARGA
jgi:hypothetical protein